MIEYKTVKEFTKEELQRLFLSVEWSSGHFPEKLVLAMKGFSSVFSAYVNSGTGDSAIFSLFTIWP